MGFSFRTYLVTQDNRVCRLASAKFDRMLRDPESDRLPGFAGQRVRMASVVVELVGRAPVRVVRSTFAVLAFDAEGRLDSERFDRQQFALAESALALALGGSATNAMVVDAASRFVAQGGGWTPSKELARAIDDAAMGRVPCLGLFGGCEGPR
jgi:hypothetical protein